MGASVKSGGRRRRGRYGSGFSPVSEINVTPLVDVMLVLLIVFMVAAPLLTAGVQVDLPNSEAKPVSTEDNKPIELTLASDGKIYIAETEVPRQRLIPLLKAMEEERDDTPRIYIRADKSLDYGRVMELLGEINGSGFNKVALISQKK